ncbi:GNAT family N-acetyltransferase [Halobaculum gomorrense]|uniref:Acetyltransferase, GNAT family n=1 Tax=Halobaculum gomorrense TaxID=43928 RepID=A0A1M5V1A5_9EURY|nr:GNAT family N-acetyltransferase [Halobaculum gomorrense]SHH68966.1 Acetyltransferase, GNAT family [Halobaculum gomorrense]
MTVDGEDADPCTTEAGEPVELEAEGATVAVDRGTVDDVDAVADLWVDLADGQRAYGTHFEATENRRAAAESVASAASAGGLVVARVAEPKGGAPSTTDEIVGFVSFGLETGRYEQDVRRGVVYNLFVRDPYRDAGVGARLLDTAESTLAASGAHVVALEAMAANRDARRFYEQQGYEPHRVELEKPIQGLGSDSD